MNGKSELTTARLRPWVTAGSIAALLLIASPSAHLLAKNIAVFDNPVYVDTAGGPAAESDALQAALLSLGHTAFTFTGIDADAFATAGASADIILFPNPLDFGQLAKDLSSEARMGLGNYVAAGHGIIVTGSNGHALLDAALGYTLASTSSGLGGPKNCDGSCLVADATGTPFASGPDPLPQHNIGAVNKFVDLSPWDPRTALSLYEDSFGGTTVFVSDFGSGRAGYLAWSYENAAPLGPLDGGWLAVLDTTVEYIPEPATGLLLLAGTVAVVRRRRGM